jgi:hypothetical protein
MQLWAVRKVLVPEVTNDSKKTKNNKTDKKRNESNYTTAQVRLAAKQYCILAPEFEALTE